MSKKKPRLYAQRDAFTASSEFPRGKEEAAKEIASRSYRAKTGRGWQDIITRAKAGRKKKGDGGENRGLRVGGRGYKNESVNSRRHASTVFRGHYDIYRSLKAPSPVFLKRPRRIICKDDGDLLQPLISSLMFAQSREFLTSIIHPLSCRPTLLPQAIPSR